MSNYTVLVCPTCGGKTSLQAGSDLATCDYCGNQLILRPSAGVRLNYPPPVHKDPIAPMPKGVRVNMLGDGLEIKRRWFSPTYIFLAFFCVIWDGFLIFWYSMAFSTGASLIFVLFPVIHLAVGIGLTYSTLAGFINTSTVCVSGSDFIVEHDPLPWLGEIHIEARELDQLYTRQVTSSGRNGTSTSYTLSAVLKDGRKVDLLKGMDSPEAGFFIEQKIENYLMIPDRPVVGEVSH